MGNRSAGAPAHGVRRTYVRLPGYYVRGTLCVPEAHPHALWLLAWVERLLQSATLAGLRAAPPWPVPADPLITGLLARELVDLRWAVPEWSTGRLRVAPALADAFAAGGRRGLARALFATAEVPGEWWMDGLGGVLLSRQTALQFDWDLRQRANVEIPPPEQPLALLDVADVDLPDLLRKLGRVDDLGGVRDRVFLAAPLALGERKDILFPLYGDDARVVPDEIAELAAVLERHRPDLLGAARPARSRVVRSAPSPVEPLAAEVAALPIDPTALGPLGPVRARVARLQDLLRRTEDALRGWLAAGQQVVPVAGPTQRQFDALREMCEALAPAPAAPSVVVLTSAFLNADNLGEADGLVDALDAAPANARFVVVYGHASDDLPAAQQQDLARWVDALRSRRPGLASRVTAIVGRRRSHEKVVVTSAGEWLVGSWNPASSRPHATVFECSLRGRGASVARQLVDRLRGNVDEPRASELLAALDAALAPRSGEPAPDATAAVGHLLRAAAALAKALAEPGEPPPAAWAAAVRALRAAAWPFLATTHLELVDEHQTRDTVVVLARAARRAVLLASDRLADSALDAATLRDLRGDARHRPVVRIVWGREWAGRRASDAGTRGQLRRAADAVRDAGALLGARLRTSVAPMENHAKALVVDGFRGIVTSENVLAYGGEKGRHESRELGLAFVGPVLARHLTGRFLAHWPAVLDPDAAEPLAWIVAGNEAWYALAPLAGELEFDWQQPAFVGAVVCDELQRDDAETAARAAALETFVGRAGRAAFAWLRDEAERLGLVRVADDGRWTPYDAPDAVTAAALVAAAETAVASPPRPSVTAAPAAAAAIDPLVARVLAGMVHLPAGRFLMGDDRVPRERPRHRVVLTRAFLLGRVPVTQALWREVTGGLPHLRDVERHPDAPIIHVGYADIARFMDALNARPGGGRFELPTEAQWEYACRAGSDATYCFGEDPGSGDRPGELERYAWTKRNAGAQLQPVGQLRPNAWGLHDMHGLVYETTRDGFRTYVRGEVRDPVGPLDGGPAVARGGCWGRFPVDRRGDAAHEHFRSAARQVHEKSHRVSFRLSCRVEDAP